MAESKVAIHTENTVSGRVSLSAKPRISVETYLLPMGFATSIDIVNRKKLNMAIAATQTQCPSISLKYLQFQDCFRRFVISDSFCSMVLIPLSMVLRLLNRVSVRHKNAASPQHAALTRHAGERQLGVILP